MEATIKKYINNHVSVPYALMYSRVPSGCKNVIVENFIPEFLEPGEYTIETTLLYDVNPIRTISVSYETEPFNIIK